MRRGSPFQEQRGAVAVQRLSMSDFSFLPGKSSRPCTVERECGCITCVCLPCPVLEIRIMRSLLLLCLIVTLAVLASGQANDSTANGTAVSNETEVLEQHDTPKPIRDSASPIPHFPVVAPGAKLSLSAKVNIVRDAIAEVRARKEILRHKYAEDVARVREEYRTKLEASGKHLALIKSKMNKLRFTKDIQRMVAQIKAKQSELNSTRSTAKQVEAAAQKLIIASREGKKQCHDLGVAPPYDNAIPHAILNQEAALIKQLRGYLTKLHYGKSVAAMEENRLQESTSFLQYDTIYAGLTAGHRNQKIEDEVLKDLGLVRSDLVYHNFDHERLKKNIEPDTNLRLRHRVAGSIAIKATDALAKAETMIEKTNPLFTHDSNNAIIARCIKRWHAAVQVAKTKSAEIVETLDELSDEVNAMIVELAKLREKANENIEVQVFLPAYHNALWQTGVSSNAITELYNFVSSQYHWMFTKASSILDKQEKLLNKHLSKYVRERDGDAGVAETCLTEKQPIGSQTGGPDDVSTEWNIECDSGLVMKALWISSTDKKDVEDMKCCKMPVGSYVNAFDCMALTIEKDAKKAVCGSGVAVGFHALARSRAPEKIKCCELIGSVVDREKCTRIPMGGHDAAGGPQQANKVWRGECLKNTVLAGFYMDENSRDIAGAECCQTKAAPPKVKKVKN